MVTPDSDGGPDGDHGARSGGTRMLGWRDPFSRPWRFWGSGLGGVVVVVQVLAAAGHSPTRGELPDPTPTVPNSHALAGWEPGRPVGIRVEDGQSTFRAPAGPRGSGVLVIVSSLARGSGPFPISLRARPANRPETPALATDGGNRLPPRLLAGDLPPIREPANGQPPADRTFHLMTRDGDVASSQNYEAITGRLRAVGKRVQVYVASDDVDRVGTDVLRDLVETFDDRVFPMAASTFGQAHDIDGDGRFTIFLSSFLARMGQGKHAVDGFVRVADLDRTYSTPFGNRCDMMYLSAELEAGPHLRTVVAHEYTHAVVFSRKTLGLGRTKPTEGRVEEEGWLDEALAHLAEDLHGFSRSNLDYRVSAFLSRPESYRLVVDDYYAANLFRSHGNRGSTYLFLRWCTDHYGANLLPTLIGSDQSGLANLEAATGSTFADLYRRWSVALAATALGPRVLDPDRAGTRFRSDDLRGPVDDRFLAGPRIDRIRPEDGEVRWNATGTSSRFMILEGEEADAVEVTISGPREADLQVTSIPLPRDLPTMDVNIRPSYDADGDLNLTMWVAGHDGPPIRLQALAWEPLIPPADPRSVALPCGRLDPSGIASHFGTSTLGAGKPMRSTRIKLPGVRRGSGPYALKLVGSDTLGRVATTWADINPAEKPKSRQADLLDPNGEPHDTPVDGDFE